jgi:16S rRNA processing protein RimM
MKKYIEIAKFTKTQGLKGDIRARTYCDSPEILETFKEFYIGENKTPIGVTLVTIRKGFVILRLENIDNPIAAGNFIGEMLYVNRDELHIPENSWLIRDLIGLEVIDADSAKVYGKVHEILQNAPKDVYVIKTPQEKQLMFPSIPEVLIDVDITAGIIKIRPLEGLFDEN